MLNIDRIFRQRGTLQLVKGISWDVKMHVQTIATANNLLSSQKVKMLGWTTDISCKPRHKFLSNRSYINQPSKPSYPYPNWTVAVGIVAKVFFSCQIIDLGIAFFQAFSTTLISLSSGTRCSPASLPPTRGSQTTKPSGSWTCHCKLQKHEMHQLFPLVLNDNKVFFINWSIKMTIGKYVASWRMIKFLSVHFFCHTPFNGLQSAVLWIEAGSISFPRIKVGSSFTRLDTQRLPLIENRNENIGGGRKSTSEKVKPRGAREFLVILWKEAKLKI